MTADRPTVPEYSVWTRHGASDDSPYTHSGYTASKRGDVWVLRYRGEFIGQHEFLAEAMKMASEVGQ